MNDHRGSFCGDHWMLADPGKNRAVDVGPLLENVVLRHWHPLFMEVRRAISSASGAESCRPHIDISVNVGMMLGGRGTLKQKRDAAHRGSCRSCAIWLVVRNIWMIFHVWEIIIPIDFHIFQRG